MCTEVSDAYRSFWTDNRKRVVLLSKQSNFYHQYRLIFVRYMHMIMSGHNEEQQTIVVICAEVAGSEVA